MARRHELTDAQFARLAPLLPPEWPNKDPRTLLNAILCRGLPEGIEVECQRIDELQSKPVMGAILFAEPVFMRGHLGRK
jgi:hypothetical protein